MARASPLFVLFFIAAFAWLSAALSPWPARHTHTEVWMGYPSQDFKQVQKWFYDFPSLSLRQDVRPFGSAIAGTFISTQNFFINNTLSMYTYVAKVPFCVRLDMGFGMMRPDWFLNGKPMTPIYNSRAYRPSYEDPYTYTGWTRTDVTDIGHFDYFFDNVTGAPYRLSAPGPNPVGSGFVTELLEYYDFAEVDSFPAETFALPNVTCSAGVSLHLRDTVSYETLTTALQPLPEVARDVVARIIHHLMSYPRQ